MEVAQRNLKRLASLVDEIIQYHQLSHRDQQSTMPVAFDIDTLCQECVEDLYVRTRKPRDSVVMKAEKGLAPVLADKDMLRRVMANLLNNAVHHGGADVQIEVAIEQLPDDRARISVTDNGAGMSEEMLRRAVEPFVSTGHQEQSMGLGLAIVNNLLRVNDSQLELESREGQWTTAAFTLPQLMVEAHFAESEITAQPADLPGPEESEAPEDRFHILVVDDDKDTCSFMELALEQHGLAVECVQTAEDGLRRLKDFAADLMLVDHCLPGMDGLAFCRLVKKVPGTADIPIYLITARPEGTIQREALEAGCEGFLIKPMAIDDLLERIKKSLKES